MKCINNTENSYQTVGAPPNNSWSPLKRTPRAQQNDFTIKTWKTQSYTIPAIEKCKNKRKRFYLYPLLCLLLLSYCMTTTVVFISFTDQVVDHWRVEPLLKTTNYNNGVLTSEMEWANNCLDQQHKPSCQEFSSWRGQAQEKPMFLILPITGC